MTNPMFNPQPNYSGVTIQIANPAVNIAQKPDGRCVPNINCGYTGVNQNGLPAPQGNVYTTYPQVLNAAYPNTVNPAENQVPVQNAVPAVNQYKSPQDTGYPASYPAQYYLNNYNYASNPASAEKTKTPTAEYYNQETSNVPSSAYEQTGEYQNRVNYNEDTAGRYKIYANTNEPQINDMSKSENIKENLAEREAEIQEEKKNTKETKIVALTDEYIKSLENYLNNPNDEIRLMASKEILTRLDEDKDRYDDAALNALLNKMMQDPNKLVRIAALSAFNSQLASGNDYTVKLLHNIQSNPNSDKEDVLQAADILLKMAAGVEVKNIPNPSVKDKEEK